MKFNDWEHFNPDKYLWDTPKEDFDDIVGYIKKVKAINVVELGFGTGVLLPTLLELDIRYYGFDKTHSFVKSASMKYKGKKTKFEVLDIQDVVSLSNILSGLKPDLILIRNTLEYLPGWPIVIDCLNKLRIRDIIISTFSAPALGDKSRSEVQFSADKKNAYTMNFISGKELDSYLPLYDKVKEVKYGERFMFRAYHLRSK